MLTKRDCPVLMCGRWIHSKVRRAVILQKRSCHLLPLRNSTVNRNHNCCSSLPHISTAVFLIVLANNLILELYRKMKNNCQFSHRISDASSTLMLKVTGLSAPLKTTYNSYIFGAVLWLGSCKLQISKTSLL